MSGPIWVKRVRQRVKELTGRNRSGVKDVRVIIADLNPVLRGWGNYFCTGNAAQKFMQIDTYAWWRLHRFMVKQWTSDFFHSLGLHRLRGTIQ